MSDGTDQYDAVFRSMEEGTLISINDAEGRSTGELEVQHSDDDETYVRCKSGSEEWKVVHRDRRGDLVVSDVDDEIGLRWGLDVVTIEILGIAGD